MKLLSQTRERKFRTEKSQHTRYKVHYDEADDRVLSTWKFQTSNTWEDTLGYRQCGRLLLKLKLSTMPKSLTADEYTGQEGIDSEGDDVKIGKHLPNSSKWKTSFRGRFSPVLSSL